MSEARRSWSRGAEMFTERRMRRWIVHFISREQEWYSNQNLLQTYLVQFLLFLNRWTKHSLPSMNGLRRVRTSRKSVATVRWNVRSIIFHTKSSSFCFSSFVGAATAWRRQRKDLTSTSRSNPACLPGSLAGTQPKWESPPPGNLYLAPGFHPECPESRGVPALGRLWQARPMGLPHQVSPSVNHSHPRFGAIQPNSMKVDDLYKVALMLLDRALEDNTQVTGIKHCNNAYYLQLHQWRQALQCLHQHL